MAERRVYRLELRLSESERELLRERAHDAGMPMSELLRDHLGRVKVRNRADERSRLHMLTRINTNLNQIAKWANTHKSDVSAEQVSDMLEHVRDSVERLAYRLDRDGE